MTDYRQTKPKKDLTEKQFSNQQMDDPPPHSNNVSIHTFIYFYKLSNKSWNCGFFEYTILTKYNTVENPLKTLLLNDVKMNYI